jgi:hypothetical protein
VGVNPIARNPAAPTALSAKAVSPYNQPYECIALPRIRGYDAPVRKVGFEWDGGKDKENQAKHGVPFALAQYAFLDPLRVIAEDVGHSADEKRLYCIGRVGEGVITVRFTYRSDAIRIYGAGYWRKGRKIYEEQNKIY